MQIEKYKVENELINSDKTIALISDIHLRHKFNKKHFNNLINNIEIINPNYITLVGDYFFGWKKYNFEEPTSRKILKYYLDALKEYAPVIMSLGNHDLNKKNEENLRKSFEKLASNNIYPLDNTNITMDDFNFYGYFPPRKYYPIDDVTKRKQSIIINDLNSNDSFEIIENKVNILLCHLPNIVLNENIQKNALNILDYDLILSGHTHNGYFRKQTEQILNAISNNLQKIKLLENYKEQLEALKYYGFCESIINDIPFIRKINRGIHDIDESKLIISRGANITHGHNESYITEIKLVRKK